jgi:hypothetical protein
VARGAKGDANVRWRRLGFVRFACAGAALEKAIEGSAKGVRGHSRARARRGDVQILRALPGDLERIGQAF